MFFSRRDLDMEGYDQQDFFEFHLPVEERNKKTTSWTSYPWAVFAMLFTAGFLRNFRFEDELTKVLTRPECFLVGIAGFMVTAFFLDFSPRKIAVFVLIGYLIAFL